MKISNILKTISIGFIIVIPSTYAYEYNYGNTNNYNSYENNSGTRYQYDLNNPSDRNNYSIDLDAQRRDSMSLNPNRNLDRSIGQFGGGIYDN